MKLILIALAASIVILSLTGCNLSPSNQPTPYPTLAAQSSPTPLVACPALWIRIPYSHDYAVNSQTDLGYVPTASVSGIVPGRPPDRMGHPGGHGGCAQYPSASATTIRPSDLFPPQPTM